MAINIMDKGKNEYTYELGLIREALNIGTENHGLDTEIIWSAMCYLKSNPEASIEKAIVYGINEWVK